MDFTGLEYFCAVVQEGSISKAAERLYITQQSLSGYIARLEQKYGCVFFERKPKLQLTVVGEQFYTFAKRVVGENEAMKRSIAEMTGSLRRLPVGVCYDNETYFMPHIVSRFRERVPNVLVSSIITDRKAEESQLRSMDVYCVISTSGRKYPGIRREQLFKNDFYAVIPTKILSSHPEISINEPVPLSRLLRMPLVLPIPATRFRMVLDKFSAEHGIIKHIVAEIATLESTFEFAKLGMGCSFIPKAFLYYLISSARPLDELYIQKIELEGCDLLPGTLSLLYRGNVSLPDYVLEFLKCAKDVCVEYDKSAEAAIDELLSAERLRSR